MRSLRLGLLALLLGSTAFAAETETAPAPVGGFILTLARQEQQDAGLTRLSAAQQVALNTFVAREVSLARENKVTGFAGTFLSRRTPEEIAQAGLDRLSAGDQACLNQYVATALAARVAGPRERPRLTDRDVATRRKLEVHGSVTLAYGWGGGREMRAGSLYVDTYDPESGVGIGIGISQVSGDLGWGYSGYYDDYYSYPYHSPMLMRGGFGGSFHGGFSRGGFGGGCRGGRF
jgi:hypothetical protein